jgi:hypothetical protein
VIGQIAAGGARLDPPPTVRAVLAAPEGLAVDRRGRLIVAETGAGRVLAIDPATGAEETVVSGLPADVPPAPGASPTWIFTGVAVDPFDNLYISVPASAQILQAHRRR